MTSPAKFRKDKEIVAEYETQVKGKTFSLFVNFFLHGHVSQGGGMCRENLFSLTVWRAFLDLAGCMGFCSLTSPTRRKGYGLAFVSHRPLVKVN